MLGACLQHATDACADGSERGSRDVDALEHPIQQFRFAAGASGVKRFLESVVKEVGGVEVYGVIELAAERPDVARVESQISSKVPGHSHSQVLNIWCRVVRIETAQAYRTIRDRNRLHRLYRHRYRNNAVQLRQIQELQTRGSREDRVIGTPRRIGQRRIDRVEPAAAGEIT